MPYLPTEWGNPSSSYKFGSKLKSVIATARDHVAELIGAHPMDVIFTSCATESNNAAIAAGLRLQFHIPAGPALPAAGTMKWSQSCHTGAAASGSATRTIVPIKFSPSCTNLT